MKNIVSGICAMGWAFLILRLTTTPQLIVTQNSVLQMILMSGAHFVFFGIQAVLIAQAVSKRGTTRTQVIAIALTSLYGLAIEGIQRGVPGRTADPVDWFLDTLGAVVFVYFVGKYVHTT